jgi:predicted AlkP superfamily pyrophosphatase or phosphodiesterase
MLVSRRKFLTVAASTALATLGFPFLSKSGATRGFGNAEEIERVILMILDGSRYEYVYRMPHLRKIVENFGFSFTNAETIMTSNTVAAHVSIITGAYPEKTGVSGNAIYIREEDFYQFVMHSPRHIQAETMVESVKKQDDGIKVAFVTGKWRVPSNIAFSRDGGLIADIVLTGYRSGIPITPVEYRNVVGIPEIHRQSLGSDVRDSWCIPAAYQVIKRDDPDFMMLNLASTDVLEHIYGPDSPKFAPHLLDLDSMLALLFKKLENEGKLSSTLFVITSDHGQHNIYNVFNMAEFLKKNGYEAEILLEGSSAFLYLREPEKRGEVVELLNGLKAKGIVKEALPVEDYHRYSLPKNGWAGDVLVILQEGWVAGFWGLTSTDAKIPLRRIRSEVSVPGDHGGNSSNEIHVPMIFIGPGIQPGSSSERVSIVDIVPTICDLMGWKMPADAQGRSLAEVIGYA